MERSHIFYLFRGRIDRQTYWVYGILIPGLVLLAAYLLDTAMEAEGRLLTLVQLAMLWPIFATQVKRWHDRDKSAWWILLSIVPVVGWIWTLIELGFVQGSPSANRFGLASSLSNVAAQVVNTPAISSAQYESASTVFSHAIDNTGDVSIVSRLSEQLAAAKQKLDAGDISTEEYLTTKEHLLKEI
ncbi:DUF805 domain-containing protein [bacterium]|nr:DUF805 domain-containing protein [bacterium]